MELQIQDLVSSIRKEGVEAARAEADSIIAQANARAAEIIAAAKDEAARIEAKSQKETEILRESTKVNAEHAQRDAVLSFKKTIQGEFEKILASDVSKTVQGPALGKLIAAALAEEDPAGYTAEVSEVTEGLKAELAEKVKAGLEIRVSKNVRSGFRLASKDGSGYFDCTDEEITQMLLPFFSNLSI